MNREQLEARMINRARRIVRETDQLIVDAAVDVGLPELLAWRNGAASLIEQIEQIEARRAES